MRNQKNQKLGKEIETFIWRIEDIQERLNRYEISDPQYTEADLKQAKVLYHKSLDLLGKEDQKTWDIMQTYGQLLNKLDYIEEALLVLEAAYHGYEVLLGKTHKKTLDSLDWYAYTLYLAGEHADGLKAFEELYQLVKENEPSNQQLLLTAMLGVGQGLYETKQLVQAQEILEDCYQQATQVYGENAGMVLIVGNWLASVTHALGKYGEARELVEDLYERAKRVFPGKEMDDETIRLQSMLITILKDSFDHEAVIPLTHDILSKEISRQGPQSLDVAYYHIVLGIEYKSILEYEKAIEHFEQAAAIYQKIGLIDDNVALIKHWLGSIYAELAEKNQDQREKSNQYQEAEGYLLKAFDLYSRIDPESSHPYNCASMYKAILKEQDKLDTYYQWLEESLDYEPMSLMLAKIYDQPQDYLRHQKLGDLANFIGGFIIATKQLQGVMINYFSGFSDYVREEYGLSSTYHRNWEEVIEFFEENDEDAFESFFEMIREYKELLIF